MTDKQPGEKTDNLDIDGMYTLIGRVFRQAVRDARRGDREAQQFLEITAPDYNLLERVARYGDKGAKTVSTYRPGAVGDLPTVRTTATRLSVGNGSRAGSRETVIKGYAAKFNSLSAEMYGFREKIAPGAFARSIKGGDVRALWQHKADQPLGRQGGGLRLREDKTGLYFELTPPNTTLGKDVLELVRSGVVDKMSFGFSIPALGDTWEEDGDGKPVRTLRDVNLHEISIVTWPAYDATSAAVGEVDTTERGKLDLKLKELELFDMVSGRKR